MAARAVRPWPASASVKAVSIATSPPNKCAAPVASSIERIGTGRVPTRGENRSAHRVSADRNTARRSGISVRVSTPGQIARASESAMPGLRPCLGRARCGSHRPACRAPPTCPATAKGVRQFPACPSTRSLCSATSHGRATAMIRRGHGGSGTNATAMFLFCSFSFPSASGCARPSPRAGWVGRHGTCRRGKADRSHRERAARRLVRVAVGTVRPRRLRRR